MWVGVETVVGEVECPEWHMKLMWGGVETVVGEGGLGECPAEKLCVSLRTGGESLCAQITQTHSSRKHRMTYRRT